METKKKINIPLKNEVVRNQIQQTLNEFSVVQLHVFPADKSGFTSVLILMRDKQDEETLRLRKWVDKAAQLYNVRVHISYYHKAEFQLKCGNPFYQYYADPSTMVWMKENLTEPLKTYRTKKAFKKKLNVFKEKFYHNHDILMTETNKFHSRNMYASAFQNYLTIFEHDIEYLENLYIGSVSFDKDIHTRLRYLIPYIPEIQKVFVMKNGHCFYLISKMEESVKAAEKHDESYISSELFDAVKTAETELYKMVADRFSEFNEIIRFNKSSDQLMKYGEETTKKDAKLEKVIDSVVTRLAPEEIYLFHKKETYSPKPDEQQAVYYLLVIGDGIGNNTICDIQQSVTDQSKGRVNIVILGHRRFSIQDCLFASQDFMQDIMTPENLVYASHQYHPPIHWQHSSSDYYGDLFLYYRRMNKTVSHYFSARTTPEDENAEMFLLLFSHAMMSILRVYIYCSLCNYLPNFNKMFDTWKLCVYAYPSLEKIEFLFEKLSPDFYKLMDSFLKYTDRLYRFEGDELIVMDEILNLLMEKLEKLIKDKNLHHSCSL